MAKWISEDAKKKLTDKVERYAREVVPSISTTMGFDKMFFDEEFDPEIIKVLRNGVEFFDNLNGFTRRVAIVVIDDFGDAVFYTVDHERRGYEVDTIIWRNNYKNETAFLMAVMIELSRRATT